MNDEPKQCEGCSTPINGEHAVGRGGFWHPECFPERDRSWKD